MRTTHWARRAQVFTLSVFLLGIGIGCRQLGSRNKISPAPDAATAPMPMSEPLLPAPNAETNPEIPPLPAAEARLRGHSRPKGRSVPVGLSDTPIQLTDGTEDADGANRTEFSDDAERTEPIDLPAPPEEGDLVPLPTDDLDGPIADATGPSTNGELTSGAVEIDVAEFLANLDMGSYPRAEAAPLPIIVPQPISLAAQQPLVESWPRHGRPWHIVVHPAPLVPLPPASIAASPFVPPSRLAAGNSSWADEPIE